MAKSESSDAKAAEVPRALPGAPAAPQPTSLLGRGVVGRCELPIDEVVEEGLNVLRPEIAVVDVVGVFPHIHRQQRGDPCFSGRSALPSS